MAGKVRAKGGYSEGEGESEGCISMYTMRPLLSRPAERHGLALGTWVFGGLEVEAKAQTPFRCCGNYSAQGKNAGTKVAAVATTHPICHNSTHYRPLKKAAMPLAAHLPKAHSSGGSF